MPEPQALRRFAQAAQKWRELIEKRSAYFVELHASGRWKHYYTEARSLALLREAVGLAERWAEMAPRLEGDGKSAPPQDIAPVAKPPRRSAA
jgi:hypothetical protein